MARQIINIGTSPNKGDGDPLRSAFDKINDNFAELYAGNNVDPSNTGTNLIPDADGTRDLGSATKRWADAYIKDFIYLNGSRIEVDANGVLLVNGSTASQRADVVGDLFGQDSTKTFDSNTNTFYGNFVGTLSADDSTVIVDGVNGELYGNLNGTLVGNVTGNVIGDVIGDLTGSITATGDIIPDTDVAYDLGSATKRFRDLYLSGSTIDLGGTTLSVVGGELQLGGVKVPTTTDVAASIAAGGNPFDQDLNTTDSPTFAGITFPDATTQSTAWTGSAPGFTYNDVGGTTEIGVTADTFDFGTGHTIDMQGNSVLFDSASIQDFAPGNIYANSGQYLYVTGKYSGGTATNVAFIYDAGNNRPRQIFYGKTEFGNNGQAPIVDFDGATINNWTDPDVVNTHSGSANIVVGGQTATMDFLTVRIVENSPGDIDVEFNYDAGGTVAVSANGDIANRFSGTTTFAAGNTTWTTMNILDAVGDKGEMTIVDHSGHKIYRVTTIAREMPGVNPGDAYCVIERLK